MKDVEDPRALKPGICGVTTTHLRIERICVKPVHAKIYIRRNGTIIEGNNPQADYHYFVVRYPYREQEQNQ